ncbi:leucine-rich repeat-containing protein 46-like [Actinia tenebrosa]|uniref:Leucine-rich repeat-containing protein 46-like n=1 Tax=Actinia tenebrosa TaxID=6105 RepID=A0A6P8HZ16_ACTTE|nr:leucine-rich repeat-containing protein 46-like [Actinia tenebrosa]
MENDTPPRTKSKVTTEISVSLIAKRNVNTKELSADKIADSILTLTHVRLDRENIKNIDNLDCLGPVTNLYLQNNEITKIENLDPLPKLRFLTLANNKIKKIENLNHLHSLMFLDLTDNNIEDFDPKELPKSLIILNMSGNPCVMHNDYRVKILQSLDKLEQLDGSNITKADRQQAGCPVNESETESDDEDEDEQEEEDVNENQENTETGTLDQHCNDILVRAKIRTMKEDADHEKRLDELETLRTDVINTARRAREKEAEEKARMRISSSLDSPVSST